MSKSTMCSAFLQIDLFSFALFLSFVTKGKNKFLKIFVSGWQESKYLVSSITQFFKTKNGF